MSTSSLVESIFDDARRLSDPAERRAYLDRICQDDRELRSRIDQLLSAHAEGEFLEFPPVMLGTAAIVPIGERPGDAIGPYKLLEQIGEGGMGLVFMAEQSQPLRRRVALKIIKPGLDTRAVIARFEAERQALALMDHPNIARVFDAGATDSGRPYFVMELVRGAPITDYCHDRRLTLRERLELFIQVCHAVQHAHQKGIIHRDLKPTNILVAQSDTSPVPKVIDFGVAKATIQPLTEKTLFTQFSQIIGTPLYMSPEQADLGNQDIDTRSDVYSLGVVLYELLTGTTPFDAERLRSVGHDEMRRIIREEEPPKPSTRATTAAMALTTAVAPAINHRQFSATALKGDLDWIVMIALDKDRRRRYESPSALADDVTRFLQDEPVQACPPTLRYKLRKFTGRNKRALAAGIVATLALLIGVGVGADHWRQVRESSRSAQDSLVAAREALADNDVKQALQRVAKAETRINAANLKNQQLLVATSALRIEASRFAKFLSLLEKSRRHRSAREIGIAPAEEALQSYQVLDSPDWLAPLRDQEMPKAYIDRLRESVYELLLLKADHLTRWQETRSPENTRLAFRCLEKAVTFHAPSRGYYWLKANCTKLSKDSDGEKSLRAKAMETAASHAAELFYISRDREWGSTSVNQGHPKYSLDESLEDYREMLRMDPLYYNGMFFSAHRLAVAGRCAEALGLWYGCAAANPNDAVVLVNRGATHAKLGQYEEAIADLREAIKREPNFANGYYNLGLCYYDSDRLKEAIETFTEAIRLDPSLFNSYQSRGSVHLELEQYEAALADYREAVRLSPKNANNHGGVGAALVGLKRFDEARRSFEEALRLDPSSAEAANDFAWLLATCQEESLRDPTKALEMAEQAVRLLPDNVDFQGTLGAAYYRNGNLAAAAKALRKSAENSRVTADCFFLAMAEWQLGNHDTARQVLSEAKKWLASRKSNSEEPSRLCAEAEQVLGNTSPD
jgi:serine/threonine protein kinase/Flp pilus assembly protein TadD